MRVVIDTNIMVSAYLGGALKVIITSWKSRRFTLVVSDAIAGKAKLIVSGDNHLLGLKSFRDIPIITTRDFIKWLEDQ